MERISFWRGKINISASSLDPGRMWFLWIGYNLRFRRIPSMQPCLLLTVGLLSALLCMLRILRLLEPPPPFLLEVLLGRVSDSSFFLLYWLDKTLIGPFVIEEPTPPSLCRSFSGEYCGRLMSANLFLSFRITTGSRCAIQLVQDDSYTVCIRHISLFLTLLVNKHHSIYLTFYLLN